jgi:AraC family transcriptional regulator, transcriptional activator of the genes for pyochelin and ferripyochelin receptors
MAYKILDSDFSDFNLSPDAGYALSSVERATELNFKTPKGAINYKEHFLNNDLSIQESHYKIDDDIMIHGRGDAGLLELQLNVSGKPIFYRDKNGRGHVAPARSGNIAFLAPDENQAKIFFDRNTCYDTFDIHLQLPVLLRYAGESKMLDSFLNDVELNRSSKFSKQTIHLNAALANTISDIKACVYGGLTKRIYLESKAYELLALLYEGALNDTISPRLHPADQEKIRKAAYIIGENLESPYTIAELAMHVGINQTKLKTGFKAVFNTTVFGYLQQLRMRKAKRYLIDTQMTMQEISWLLGYPNASNFSTAFKNIHGISPAELRKRN